MAPLAQREPTLLDPDRPAAARTFTFYRHATGLTEINPKTNKKVPPADPGGDKG